MEAGTASTFDRCYAIDRLKRQARSARLEAARAASALAEQLNALAMLFEVEATALEFAGREQPRAAT